MYAVAVALSGIIVAIGLRLNKRESATRKERAHRGRIVGIASGVEALLIFIAVNVLANMGRRDLAAPAIAIIVGLHFFPLARWLPARPYYATGAALVFVGIAGLAVPDAKVRLDAVCIAAACVLWLTGGIVLWLGRRRVAAARPL